MALNIKSILHRINRRDISFLPKIKINKYSKIAFIFLAIFSTFLVTKTILAQTNTSTATETQSTTEETINTTIPTKDVQEFLSKQDATIDSDPDQESWTGEFIGSAGMVGIIGLGGSIPAKVLEGGTTTPTGEKINWVPGGLIGLTTKSIAALYDIPVSGVEYLAHVKDNFLGKSAFAAGGYEGLSPLIPIWKGFRNVTYVLFSVIFVVIGILIMLRVKISPQAVITLQNSIPKLVTSLVLVTFSYAVVGLLIDFSYVITGLGISVVSKAGGFNYDVIKTLEHPAVLGKMIGLAPFGAIGIVFGIITAILLATAPVAGVISGLVLIVVYLVLFIVILVQVIKFFLGLIKCYLTILLKTIIAPLEIALGAIPNMKMGFNTWFMDVFANIMVFPITLIFLVLAEIITTTIRTSASSGATGWLTGNSPLWTPPNLAWLLSGGDIAAIAIGIGALTLVAKMPKLIPEFIFQIKPSPYGKAIGDSLGAGWNSFVKSGPVSAATTFGKLKGAEEGGKEISKWGKKLEGKYKGNKYLGEDGLGGVFSTVGGAAQSVGGDAPKTGARSSIVAEKFAK